MFLMDKGGSGDDLSANIISHSLSYLLTDPPRPLSALAQTVTIIINRKPFDSIESNSPVLQKWNTRMSSLLQSKNVETRYWGVCLVKATISNEGQGISHAVVWAKLLTSLLNRSESPVVLERAIATLQECFRIVGKHASFSRDLNALLPGYFSSLLSLANQPALLAASLKALHRLIPEYPHAFRPCLTSANTLLLKVFAGNYSPKVVKLAAQAYVDLHHSAAKGTNSEHWRASGLGIIGEAHIVLNHIFESLEEDRSRVASTLKGIGLPDEPVLSLGIERFHTFITILEQFLTSPTKQPVNLPLGHLIDLALRVYAVGPHSRPRDGAPKSNVQAVLARAPLLYCMINSLLSTTLRWYSSPFSLKLIDSIGKSFLAPFRSVFRILSDLVATCESSDFKSSAYNLVSQLVGHFGTGLHSPRAGKILEPVIKAALADISTLSAAPFLPSFTVLAPRPPLLIQTSAKSRKRKHNSNQPVEAPTSSSALPSPRILSAVKLISDILRLTPLLSLSVRCSVDQVLLSTALKVNIEDGVVCAIHKAIVTSIQHPAGIAFLPHAIRILQRDSSAASPVVSQSATKFLGDVEMIIHPRMPRGKSIGGPTFALQDGVDDMEKHQMEEADSGQVGGNVHVPQTMDEEFDEQESDGWEEPFRAVDGPMPVESARSTLRTPLLPSFVTDAPPGDGVAVSASVSDHNQFQQESLSTGTERTNMSNDGGVGSGIRGDANEDEIPEIDMGFDSDEE